MKSRSGSKESSGMETSSRSGSPEKRFSGSDNEKKSDSKRRGRGHSPAERPPSRHRSPDRRSTRKNHKDNSGYRSDSSPPRRHHDPYPSYRRRDRPYERRRPSPYSRRRDNSYDRRYDSPHDHRRDHSSEVHRRGGPPDRRRHISPDDHRRRRPVSPYRPQRRYGHGSPYYDSPADHHRKGVDKPLNRRGHDSKVSASRKHHSDSSVGSRRSSVEKSPENQASQSCRSSSKNEKVSKSVKALKPEKKEREDRSDSEHVKRRRSSSAASSQHSKHGDRGKRHRKDSDRESSSSRDERSHRFPKKHRPGASVSNDSKKRSRHSKSPANRKAGSQRRKKDSNVTLKDICLELNDIKNMTSQSEKKRAMEDFMDAYTDSHTFAYESPNAARHGPGTYITEVMHSRPTRVTRRVLIDGPNDTSYCFEAEWIAAKETSLITLYVMADQKLIRCYEFEDTSDLGVLQRQVDLQTLLSTKVWAICKRYMIKKGVEPSTKCYFTDCTTKHATPESFPL